MVYKNLTCEDLPNGTTVLRGPCHVTGKEYSVTVLTSQLRRWLHGELIQDAMPNLLPHEREFLISGTSPEGWKQTFGDEEE